MIIVLFVGLYLKLACGRAEATAEQPNVVFILADDQNIHELPWYASCQTHTHAHSLSLSHNVSSFIRRGRDQHNNTDRIVSFDCTHGCNLWVRIGTLQVPEAGAVGSGAA